MLYSFFVSILRQCYLPIFPNSGLLGLSLCHVAQVSLDQLMSSVGRPKHPRIMAGAIQDDLFIGRRAQELRGLLKIQYPMEHGVVTDWDDMERIWGWVYAEGLKALSEEVS
jgi:hypothetical protein